MNKIILVLLFIAVLNQAFSQSNREQAIELKDQAIELMDNGNIEESLQLLNQAKELDPDNITITYEIAFAYQLSKDHEKCIETVKPLLKHPDVFDQVFQIIGNSYDLLGNKVKAIKYYDKGIKKFPNSGRLYLEKGVVLASQEKWFEALEIWEQGIVADPVHSSNYYWAAQVLAQTNEKIWAVYYGEIFINLEQDTERSKAISRILYDTYKACLPVKENKWSLNFSQKATVISLGNIRDFKLSFETVHNLAMEDGYNGIEPVFNIENLIKIRKQFLVSWNQDYKDTYPNIIFDYHNLLEKNKLFECYIYWLLNYGAIDDFEIWHKENKESYNNFLAWFKENPLFIDSENKVNRFSY